MQSTINNIRDTKTRMTRGVHGRDTRNAYKITIGKHERDRPLRRPRRIWKNDIEVDVKETVCEDMN